MRTNWKTKNFNPDDNPLEDDSSSEDYGNERVDDDYTESPDGKRLDTSNLTQGGAGKAQD